MMVLCKLCKLGPDLAGFLLSPFRKPKRVRTAFSPSQLLKLEHAFEKNHYVVGAERKQLAQNLNLTETQVRSHSSSSSSPDPSSTLPPPPPLFRKFHPLTHL